MNKDDVGRLIEEIRAGVDWISATVERHQAHSGGFFAYAESCVRAAAREGNQIEERTLLGFRGIKAGGCFVGANERMYYCQLSGEYADRWFSPLDSYWPHYSRIDLQVTVKFRQERTDIAQSAYREYTSDTAKKNGGAKRKAYIIIGSDGGDTCYIGAPSSRQRARIYNKARQSEQAAYERCWQYEVVLRDELAREWAQLYRGNLIGHPEHAMLSVGKWFDERGVWVPFRYKTDIQVLPKVRTLPTDVERKITWLSTQVRPTIEYLIEQGFESIVKEALGLVPGEPDGEREHGA